MHVARLSSVLKLRAVVPEDAEVACQVFDAHDPDEPQDPDVTRHRWTVNTPDSVRERFLIEQCGRAVGFAFRGHKWWEPEEHRDRKSTRLNSSHSQISYA